MSIDNINWEEFNNMSETEQIKHEEAFIHHASLNSYRLLVGNTTYQKFLEEEEPTGALTFMHDITSSDDPDKEDILNLIDYFAERDDFDKCIALRDKFIKNK
tara:strand:+ start:2343 stop:2648 length:306 start_codon:yes stop_codon:yes gene_type:complete